jgi:hypothetical protein
MTTLNEANRDRQKLLSSLVKITHRDLTKYVDEVLPAAKSDALLYNHLIAWNEKNGRIKESKIALPVIALRTDAMLDSKYVENVIAHIGSLSPRELLKAYRFSTELSKDGLTVRHVGGKRKMFHKAIQAYLRQREADFDWWTAAVIRSRKAMMELYRISHLAPAPFAKAILFDRKYPSGSVFDKISKLRSMSTLEAANTVVTNKIPITVATGAGLDIKALDNEEILIALLSGITGNELIIFQNMLSKLESYKLASVQSALKSATNRMKKDKKVTALRATRAKKSTTSETAVKVLSDLKESAAIASGSIKGDWLILADKSPSMENAVAIAKELAGLLAHRVEGDCHLIFFDSTPFYYNISGMKLDEIEDKTHGLKAGGWGTSIGAGVKMLRSKKKMVDGIVIVTDGGENSTPYFAGEYAKLENEPSVYIIGCGSPGNGSQRGLRTYDAFAGGVEHTLIDASKNFDHTAMGNVINILKPGTYGFLEEVLETPFLTLDKAFGGFFKN